jgi:hypothetical protein
MIIQLMNAALPLQQGLLGPLFSEAINSDYSKTPILNVCGDYLKMTKRLGRCKIQETLFLWAFDEDHTKSV